MTPKPPLARPAPADPGQSLRTAPLPAFTPPPPPEWPFSEASAPADDPLRGTAYRFVRALDARAEMGELVEAEHTALRRRVIVKLLGSKLVGSEDYADRMRLEAQALAAISHPHVVTVLDVGRTPEGRIFLVMEKLVGRTLAEELAARGFLPVAEAVAIVGQLLDGLAAVHGAGLVHRDVKPANLFLCDAARGPRVLKIIDFGITKIVRGQAREDGPLPLAQPTAPLAMVGTPRFMAPEQIVLERVGPWTDLYATGAVLYALVNGRDPFGHHRDQVSVLQAHVDEKPPLPSVGARQSIPEAVERVIMKALEKRAADRWASAAEMSEALDRALRVAPPATEPRPVPSRGSVKRAVEGSYTAGGGTAIQPSPRAEPATPPREMAVPRAPAPRRARSRRPLVAIGAVALAALVGTLTGVVIRSRYAHDPVASHEVVASAAPPALPSVASAPSPPPPGMMAAPSVAPAAASARPPAVVRLPRRTQAPSRPAPAPAVATVAPPPAPPSPPAKPPENRRPFGVEE